MAEEEHYEDVDISDMIEDTDQYFDGDHMNTEGTDSEAITIQPTTADIVVSDEQTPEARPQVVSKEKVETIRSTRLPIARIKNIMKQDPDVSVLSGDAVFLVTKATEMFLETIAKEAYAYTSSNKRKVITKKDFDVVVNKVDCLCFLEGAMDF